MKNLVRSLFLLILALPATAQEYDPNYLGTYSIIARDPATGELGVGVQSKAFAAGNRAYSAKGGLAVIAHQASSNPMYGELGIRLLQQGMTPQQALDTMLRSDEGKDNRQVAILDFQGRAAAFTGTGTNDWKGHKCGLNYCAQGNTLTGPEVVDALAKSFESSKGPLAERLLDALDAAQAAGGDARGMQSGAIVIVRALGGAAGYSDRVIDIRVDDHRQPLVELRRILNMLRSGPMITQANNRARGGDLQGALQAANDARAKSPDNDAVYIALANIYLRMNDRAQAFENLRKAVELNPGNKRQLPRNQNFQTVIDDPEFKRITGS